MSTSVNNGKSAYISNIALTGATDSPMTIPKDVIGGSGTLLKVNTMIVKCRTAKDLQLRTTNGNVEFFTIPSGTTQRIEMNPVTQVPFWLRSADGTSIVAEIIYLFE